MVEFSAYQKVQPANASVNGALLERSGYGRRA